MAQWLIDIDNERRRVGATTHLGRLRTGARRIAGIALAEYRRAIAGIDTHDNFIVLLHACTEDDTLPDSVRAAARRLEARVGADFSSPSTDPLADADIIVNYVRSAMQKS